MKTFLSIATTLVLIALFTLGFYVFVDFLEFSKDPMVQYYVIIILSGGTIGGLLRGLFDKGGKFVLGELRLGSAVEVEFGSLYEILAGIGAALAVFFLLAGVVVLGNDIWAILRILAVSIIAGVGGKTVLGLLRTRFERELGEVDKRLSEAENREKGISYYSRMGTANSLLIQGDFHSALEIFRSLQEDDPTRHEGYIGQAAALKRIAQEEFEDNETERLRFLDMAIEKTSEAIRKAPDNAQGYYNRACYTVLRQFDIQDVLADLRRSIELRASYKQMARRDRDFAEIRENQLFLDAIL